VQPLRNLPVRNSDTFSLSFPNLSPPCRHVAWVIDGSRKSRRRFRNAIQEGLAMRPVVKQRYNATPARKAENFQQQEDYSRLPRANKRQACIFDTY
jgi:hypothetical protein